MAARDIGILTTLRSEPLLLMSKENVSLVPSKEKPCQFYMLQYHHDRLFAAAKASDRTISFLGGEGAVESLATQILGHLESEYGHSSHKEPLKVQTAFLHVGWIHC